MADINVSVSPPDQGQLESDSQLMLTEARAVTIHDAEQFESAADQLKAIKARRGDLDTQRKELVKPLNDTVKRINDLFRRPLQLLDDAERAIKQGMVTFQRAEEERRREAQHKAEEAARKERERLERQRLAAEAKAREKEEALRREAEAADAERRAQLEAQMRADRERAEAKQAQLAAKVDAAQAPVVPFEKPKAAGVSTRKNWKAQVVDLKALCTAVAEGKAPARFIQANEQELNKIAKALQDDTDIPGVRVYSEDVVSARAG